jgi:hypothetical protein
VHDADRDVAFVELTGFRQEFYDCLTARADALFELADACCVLRARSARWSVCRWRRSTGALYDGINHGHVDIARLRNLVAAQRLPRAADGRIVLVVDVSPWLRPDASTSPERSFCHTYGRGKDQL